MGTRDSRVDAYIENAAAFARPILREIRARVHRCCPDIVETIKWRSVSFEKQGIVCGMSAFKAHCAFGFWKHDLVVGSDRKALEAMGSFGRLTKSADLPPPRTFAAMMKKAVQLNLDGVKSVRPKHPKARIPMHEDLTRALARSNKARATFDAFPPGQQREYLQWVAEAKQDATRARRVAQAIAWMERGRPRNWKYMKR
jgi:hypothetical protein